MLEFLEKLAHKTLDRYEQQLLAAAQNPETAAKVKAAMKRFAPRLQPVAAALFPSAAPMVAIGFETVDELLAQ